MIIRDYNHAIKYTHDAEACFFALRKARELYHVSNYRLREFIDSSPWSRLYYYDPDYGIFVLVKGFYGSHTNLIEVELFNVQEVGRSAVEYFDFSCIVCGEVHLYKCRTKRFAFCEVDVEAVERQVVKEGVLICYYCKILINLILLGIYSQNVVKYIEDLQVRMKANPVPKYLDAVKYTYEVNDGLVN